MLISQGSIKMIYEVQIPRVNANEDEVLLTEILVIKGSYVTRNSEVAIIETSKASSGIDVEENGWVTAIHATEGEMVAVGSMLLSFSSEELEVVDDGIPLIEVKKRATPPSQTAKDRLNIKNLEIASKTINSGHSTFEPESSNDLIWVKEARARLDELISNLLSFTTNDLHENFPDADFGENVAVRAKCIHIGKGTCIGAGTLIDADLVYLGDGVSIGKNTEIVTGELIVADGATVGNEVLVDLAGGRSSESRLLLGPASLVGGRAHINTSREVILEAESALSPGAMIFTHSFWQSALDGYPCRFEGVRLAYRAWVGAGCQVLPGVIIGPGAVAVSNSSLVENIPPYVMVAGVPATVIRSNLGQRSNPTRQRSELMVRLTEFWKILKERGCSVSLSETGALITLPDKTEHNIVVLGHDEEGAIVPVNSIILSFGPQPVEAFSILDLANNVAIGNEDRLVHSLRNFLRRLGVRLQPFSWRPDYRKEV
jgi:acetyltransferase-like isoleucine patch superfamily enzyme